VQGSAQAGVAIRETLDSTATEGATVYQAPAVYFWDRPSTGASASNLGYAYDSTLPYWLELVRSGNTFNTYTSINGVYWTQVGTSQTITMAQSVYIGLAVTNGNGTSMATATFDNVSISSAASPAPVITALSATTGSVGSQVVISGSGFGASQGNSLVTLSGTAVTVNSWSATSIVVTIPSAATSGPMVISVAPSMNDSNPVVFEVTTQPLPTSWLDQDVGSVGVGGSATYTNGTFTVNGDGQGITGTSDAMHFVYQPLSGDGTIVARVVSVQGSYPLAGVMIRETLDGAATEASTVCQGQYLYFYDRTTTGASASYSGYVYDSTSPYWLEVVRSGSTFSSYYSADGVNWTQLGTSQTISMVQNVYVGLMVASGDNSTLATATFDNVSITSP
ncbi:MAG: DUF1349 domain-containing protein, partial [Candidatus Acidiferrales bacterium]